MFILSTFNVLYPRYYEPHFHGKLDIFVLPTLLNFSQVKFSATSKKKKIMNLCLHLKLNCDMIHFRYKCTN